MDGFFNVLVRKAKFLIKLTEENHNFSASIIGSKDLEYLLKNILKL